MSDKREQQLQKLREQTAALVEPGETLRHVSGGTKGLYWLALGPLGVAMLRFRVIALTDKALYIMPVKLGKGPTEVQQRIPLPVDVRIESSPLPRQDKFVIDGQSFHLGAADKEEGEKIAAATSAPAAA